MSLLPQFMTRLPDFEDEGELRRARIINITVWLIAITTSTATLNSMLTAPRGLAMYAMFGGLVVALFIARAFMLAKHLNTAGFVTVGAIWVVIIYVVSLDGLQSPAVGSLVLVAIIGAAVVGTRGAVGVGVGSAMLIWLIHVATEAGLLHPSTEGLDPQAMAITYAMQIMVGAVLIALLTRERNTAFSRAYDLAMNAPDGILAVDERRIVRSVNREFERVTGLRRAEVLGRELGSWPILNDAAKSTLRDAIEGLETPSARVSFELELTPARDVGGKSPELVRVECLARRLPPSQSRHRFHISVRDITKRKQLEVQLRHAQKMESIGRLAGGIAHDFNNILTAIYGNASFLAEDATQNQQAEIQELLGAVERATALTRGLLLFSRKQPERSSAIDIVETTRALATMLRRLIGEDVKLVLDLAATPQLVMADPSQFEQIVVNLVVNARDAMPDGGTIDIIVQPGDGDGVVLKVRDCGVGMSEDAQERAFDPFFSTKALGKGTGLGLSVVHGAIERAGGWIELSSTPNRGTTVTAWFPRTDAKPTKTPRAADPLPGNDELILVVEDDAVVLRVTQRMLRNAGYRVLPAASAEEALALVDEHGQDIHAMLSDVIMEGTNGPELAERVEELSPGTAILLMSGYTGDVLSAKMPGGSLRWPLLHKPFTAALLSERIRAALRHANAAETATSAPGK